MTKHLPRFGVRGALLCSPSPNLGSLSTIALIVTALTLMLDIVKPADAVRYFVAILGIVIVLMMMPRLLLNAWSSMSVLQQILLPVIGAVALQCLRPRRAPKRKR